jgi:nitrogen regulatory protein P-II 1
MKRVEIVVPARAAAQVRQGLFVRLGQEASVGEQELSGRDATRTMLYRGSQYTAGCCDRIALSTIIHEQDVGNLLEFVSQTAGGGTAGEWKVFVSQVEEYGGSAATATGGDAALQGYDGGLPACRGQGKTRKLLD